MSVSSAVVRDRRSKSGTLEEQNARPTLLTAWVRRDSVIT
jgi:hypothetical protein